MTDQPDLQTPRREPPIEVDLRETLIRLVAGGIGEGVDRLRELAAQLDSAEVDTAPESAGPYTTSPGTMAFLGMVYEAPDLVSRASTNVAAMLYPFTRIGEVAIDTGAYVAEATGLAPFLSGLTQPARDALAAEIERLSSVGTAEYARGRILATEVFTQSVDGIVGYLSESEEVGDLIREQTLGFAGGAVQEVRETGAAADGLTEGIFRRIFGREIAVLPPKPVFESE
jgi:hypothetical protein